MRRRGLVDIVQIFGLLLVVCFSAPTDSPNQLLMLDQQVATADQTDVNVLVSADIRVLGMFDSPNNLIGTSYAGQTDELVIVATNNETGQTNLEGGFGKQLAFNLFMNPNKFIHNPPRGELAMYFGSPPQLYVTI